MTGLIERRSSDRAAASEGMLLFFSAQRGIFTCEVCDLNRAGARVKLNGVNVLPPNFNVSFDNFRTVQKCRLIWRRGDFIGIAFES
jgi:hypothetical protein